MDRLVLASGNAGKHRELAAMLEPLGIDLALQSQWQVAPVAETGLSFVENALIKARHAARVTGLPALADDSGLMVDALDGAPGLYSARFAGPEATDAENVAKLLDAVGDLPPGRRGASFVCVLALLRHAEDPAPVICEGEWRGRIAEAPRGGRGFGYDPVFLVPGEDRTAAELEAGHKNRISHRGRALAALVERLKQGAGHPGNAP